MNISDLNYFEQMNQETDLVSGGFQDFDVTTIKEQVSDINQDALSDAKATAQFGGALAVSDAANVADLIQAIG